MREVGGQVTHQVGRFSVTAAVTFGPRLVGLVPEGGPDLLVRLGPDIGVDDGNGGVFRFRGGHRLWLSPEVPEVTYSPDDAPCVVTYAEGRMNVEGVVDGAGFIKELTVSAEEDRLVVDHRATWTGVEPITVGAWAITQVPLGGRAILPLGSPGDGTELKADRSLVLWPFTRLTDQRLSMAEDAVLIETVPGGRLKLGSGPTPGSIGYLHEGWLFTKSVGAATDLDYPDRGAVAQVFTNEDFCELESLGPLRRLQSGGSIEHREVWFAARCPDRETALARLVGTSS